VTLRQLRTLATRQQVMLEKVKSALARDFASVVPQLEKVIVGVITQLKVEKLGEASRRELEGILKDAAELQQKLIDKSETLLKEKLRDVQDYQVSLEARKLDGFLDLALSKKTVDLKEFSVSQPTKDQLATAFKEAMRRPLSTNGVNLENYIHDWGKAHIGKVEEAARRAWVQGRTIGSLIQEIRGTKLNGYRDGIIETSRRNAETIARTATQQMAQQAHQVTWAENDDIVTGWQFIATLDARTTVQCQSLDKQKFKIGEGPVPPLHPNCRSTTIPVLDDAFDFLDEGATRSSLNGYVDGKQSYYDWLKEQPASFQDEALGTVRAKLFREGGLSSEEFARLNLGKNFQPLSLEEMQKREPLIFADLGINVKPSNPR
jgi:SPP1 gp7 family putative phage head morphogenesis protein